MYFDIGDWGFGDWPNPQSPIPNPHKIYKNSNSDQFYKNNTILLLKLYIYYLLFNGIKFN